MKAPDKIYLANTECRTLEGWHRKPFAINGVECIEYTHTDAFIEKACDAYCKVCGHYHHTTPNHICRQACDYYKDFVNYMKG